MTIDKRNYDLIIKQGSVIDPKNKIDRKICDVAIKNGKIAKIESNIKDTADKIIDASGYYITPGLIDLHCHIYPTKLYDGNTLPNICADAHTLCCGVTTAVDAGTCGWANFLNFKEDVIDKSKVNILSFINIASHGMIYLPSEQTPKDFHAEIAASVANTFNNTVVGIKAAHYWGDKPFDEEHPAWASVDAGIKAAELCGKTLMVDFKINLPECTYDKLITKKLRKGDIHTHIYAQQFPVVDQNGKVYDYMHSARDRGILFDLGHGAGSFWFRCAIPSFKEGFAPDTLSSDLYIKNINGPAINLLHIMSKYLAIGMDLHDVIEKTTSASAKAIGHNELGNLDIGACADIAILKICHGDYGFTDCGNAKITAKEKLECVATLRKGELVYNPNGLGLHHWENAPEAYWTGDGVIN